ncbi:MAG TPA: hypothetical protein VJI97_00560 [Candidatus Nanoarchaeia archaeon]|nr:hypothetical protein [Candidatus Nanoarchaeia archaeon]
MDEEEIEGNYEEEKQNCMDKYLADLEAGKDKEAAMKKYEETLQKSIAKYNASMIKQLEGKKSQGFKGFINKIKMKVMGK